MAAENQQTHTQDPERLFRHPPESAKPGVLWMWMGSNLSKDGITKDLEALKEAGFNRTTMFSLADVTTPWAGEIKNSPTPQLISWTEPWWAMVRHAALESHRLGMDFGMFNGPGYESSGGVWVTPEHSMQELCWSKTDVEGGQWLNILLERPQVDPRANMPWPVYNPETDRVEKPVIPARKTYYRDVVVLAAPSRGVVSKDSILDLTDRLQADGSLRWAAPKGHWTLYRIGHTTMGVVIQPAQWKATGLECDKMSAEAVSFHMDRIIGGIREHLGDLIGKGFTHVHFDSYEAGTPGWTPLMRQEFSQRRGYDLKPYLLTFCGRNVGGTADSLKFRKDFEATILDLYRDVYFATVRKKLHEAGLEFLCEPYGGPWRQDDIMPYIDKVMTEFWTNRGVFTPYELEPTVASLRKSGQNIVEAEAFTGHPGDSPWTETPHWIKPIGDAAFCAGVNRLVLHRFTQQPWDERFLPGATMGQWGTHFDRTQTWWKEFPAMVRYWQRCQALLQWGNFTNNDCQVTSIQGGLQIRSIRRQADRTDVYFLANTAHASGTAVCRFQTEGRQPECWDPVTGELRKLTHYSVRNGTTEIPMNFDDAQSFFIVFRKATKKLPVATNSPARKDLLVLSKPWLVNFDSRWGGPAKPVLFERLDDWTMRPEPGIRYYSGTATYRTEFDGPSVSGSAVFLNLGKVGVLAHVYLNSVDLGTVWTAPWEVRIPKQVLKERDNRLEIQITNVWANRLIGDEQEPDDCEWLPGHQGGRFLKRFPDWFVKGSTRPSSGRYCFTTWNYFTKQSNLVSSGLMGPVRLIVVE